MNRMTEIDDGLFQITTFVPDFDLQFHQFLVKDDEPLLMHTGPRALFPAVRDVVAGLMDPSALRWIAFSHFEADECGALREWQGVAPQATALCSLVGKMVSVDDVVALRPARALADGETVSTGQRAFRFLQTPQVPHAWDAGLFFEETSGTLFCSDLFHQSGDVEAVTESDVVGRAKEALLSYQRGPLAHYLPFTPQTVPTFHRLATLNTKLLAAMHGSSYRGNGAEALKQLAAVLQEILSA
jgi:flavorubredoxin